MQIEKDTLEFIEYPETQTQRLVDGIIKKLRENCPLAKAACVNLGIDTYILKRESSGATNNDIRKAICKCGQQ